jgi:hypothetical protein
MLNIEIVIGKIFRLNAIRRRAFSGRGFTYYVKRCLIIVAIVDLDSSVTIK